MKYTEITPDLTVADLLARWPETIPVFIKHKLSCVGCAMAPFDSLSEVAKIYDLGCECFLNELRSVIEEREWEEVNSDQ
ncbi:MAG TPA: DUF1858 domain-containing protein [Anaerolineales bacterium]